MELTDRKLKILRAIIDDYIATGIPVGSRTLSKMDDISCSSATIRNEMADLEEMGYLVSPHTSAGRIPSDQAYRLYVNTLMNISKIGPEDAKIIRQYFNSKMGEIEDIVETTAKALSEATKYVSMVLLPQLSEVQLRRIQIVKIMENKAMIILVTNTGMIKDMVINISADMEEGHLDQLSNLLTARVRGLTLEEAVQSIDDLLHKDMKLQRSLIDDVISSLQKNLYSRGRKDVVLGGAQNIFYYPEYKNVDKAKNFLEALETKDVLFSMLKKATNMEFTISIGKENEQQPLQESSIVTATYKIGDNTIGSFGVIGPTRMNYGRVLSVLSYVGKSMNQILSYYLDHNPHDNE